MSIQNQTVVIVGGGPSGSTLASLLARRGVSVTIFDDGKRPDLVVGESLIPAIIPVLRKLEIEERVAAIALRKPGVSFVFGEAETIDFTFSAVTKCGLPTYAYNVPRPAFDRILEERATELGARRVPTRAKIERLGDDGLKLADESLALAPWLGGRQPDLLVDATGRARLFARLLDIPSATGPRRDVAYFAHYEGFTPEEPRGQVAIERLESGWSWCIPLRDCMSCGVVLNKDDAAKLGATAEERLEAAIDRDPVLARKGQGRQRISEVATYTNYQLISNRGYGPGWTMSGDAFGFVDPMLSPGLWLALHSAELLADRLGNLAGYDREMRRHLQSWMEFIAYYYDGRMFAMYHSGMGWKRKYDIAISHTIHRYVESHIACMASGGTTSSSYSRGFIKFMARHGIQGVDPAALAIR